jgi:predicted amidophosphoribosyltransferase
LLIDDIYTTGATADACSKVLKEAGALEVLVLSLASGGNRKPEEN